MRTDNDPIPNLKRQMGDRLARLLTDWPTHNAAARWRTDRSRIADIRRGDLKRFSLEQLIRLATRAGKRIEIVMHD